MSIYHVAVVNAASLCIDSCDGGATASAGIILYVDGASVAGTATDSGSYTAMEDKGGLIYVGGNEGGNGAIDNVWTGDLGAVNMSPTELTADQVWELYIRTRGRYNQ